MSWLMKCEEKIYICGMFYYLGNENYIKIGLINRNFEKYCEFKNKKEVSDCIFEIVNYCICF